MDHRTARAISLHVQEITHSIAMIELLSENHSTVRQQAEKLRRHSDAIRDLLDGKSVDVV